MEPLETPPVIEYVIAGVDAERICARGPLALRRDSGPGPTAGRREGDMEVRTFGGVTWRMTLPSHPAHPAVVMDYADNTRTLCGYGPAVAGIALARRYGFRTDEIEARRGRFETIAR